jgi:hypothetical protein
MMPPDSPMLPPELQQQVASELRADEKLIWADQPLPRLYQWQAIGAVLFGIPWTAFAVFWVAMTARATSHAKGLGPLFLFPLFGIPFILIGLGMLTSPFWLRRKAYRSIYVITSKRAVVMEGRIFGGVKVQSFMPDRLPSMTRKERADGTGDLIFEQFQQRAGSGSTTVRRGFMGVRNVRAVEDLIVSTLLAGRTRPV